MLGPGGTDFPRFLDNTASGIARSSTVQGWNFPADLLFASLWDKTASGTARSTTLVIEIIMSQACNLFIYHARESRLSSLENKQGARLWDLNKDKLNRGYLNL